MKRIHDVLSALYLSCLVVLPAMASAQEAEPVRQVVPYTGHLDRDGAPFDGVAALRFRLYLDPVGDVFVWQEIHRAVNVRDGRFAVRLGDGEGVAEQASIFDVSASGAQLYLELSVGQAAAEGVEPEWTTLAGRQAIHPVPQAVWTATATELPVARLYNPGDDPVTVDDDLRVAGAVNVSGDAGGSGLLFEADDGGPRITGVDGAGAPARVSLVGRTSLLPAPGEAPVIDVGNLEENITLTVGRNGENTRVRGALRGVDGVLQVNGSQVTTGDITAGDDLFVNDDMRVDDQLTARRLRIHRVDDTYDRIDRFHQHGNGFSQPNDGTENSGLLIEDGLCFLTEVNISGDCRVIARNRTWQLEAIGNSTCAMRCLRWLD